MNTRHLKKRLTQGQVLQQALDNVNYKYAIDIENVIAQRTAAIAIGVGAATAAGPLGQDPAGCRRLDQTQPATTPVQTHDRGNQD